MNRQRVSLRIAADHPALAGHFPGFPIVPGVVLLDETLHAIEQALATEALPWHIGNVKFHHVVRAGEELLLDFESQADQQVHFELHASQVLVASGILKPRATTHAVDSAR